MKWGTFHLLWLLLLAGSTTTSCGAACDTAMRFSTLNVDFSSLPNQDGLEFIVECPDRDNQDDCTAYNADKRYNASTDTSVHIWLGVQSVRITVFVRGTTEIVALDSLKPIPWDPPIREGPCGPTSSQANWKIQPSGPTRA